MFIDTELSIGPSYGWQGGPGSSVRPKGLRNQHERREIQQDLPRHTFTLPFRKIRNVDYLIQLKAAFVVCRGPGHSFKVRDWSDYEATAEALGAAPAGTAAVQLLRNYTFGTETLARPITKPDAASVVVYQNTGSGPVAKPGTVDPLTGLFTPSTAWTAGAALTWTGRFFVPVRFANDAMPTSIPSNYGSEGFAIEGSVDLIEVFGE